jgi:N-acyl-D-amino-acid deacylase
LTFDTEVYDLLRLRPFLPEQAKLDPRWKKVTIRQCLQHTTGMDRDISGDPIEMTYEIARAMGTEPPPSVPQLLRFSLGRPLDHDPGTAYAYGNIGYLMLGRVIAAITKTNYYDAVRGLVLKPLGMASTLQARSIPNKRPDREVSYYDTNGNTGTGLVPPVLGKQVPTPDGGSNLENFEGFGGWASTAQDMVRLASAFDDPSKCQLLKEETISAMWARPDGAPGRTANGRPKSVYYGCGWNVRPIDEGNRVNAWHFGILSGVSTLLVRRNDGFTWALLFNGDYLQDGKTEAAWDIAEAIHPVVDGITKWPTDDLFEKDK